MSLLLNVREWVGLGEAMTIAAREGVFALSPNIGSNVDARWQLLLAYAEDKRPLRLCFDGEVFFASFFEQKVIGKRDKERHPVLETFSDTFDVFYQATPRYGASICFLDNSKDTDDKHFKRQAYLYEDGDDYGGYYAVTWDDVVEAHRHGNNHLLQLRTDSLLELFAKARGVAPVQADQPKEINAKSVTSYQNIIGAMIKLLQAQNNNYLVRKTLIQSIRQVGDGRIGTSESHLSHEIPNCERVFESR